MRARRALAATTATLAFAMVAGYPGAAALASAAGAGHGGRDHGGRDQASRDQGSRDHRAAGSVGQASGPGADQGGAQLARRGTVVNYPAAGHVRRLPRVRASAFVVADARTGQVLAARDAHGWYRPASTLKVLTAITLIPVLNPHATTVASHEAATTEPNDVGLKAGRRYRISGLFRALLTISANDAAVALAQATGSLRRGVALMNAEARRLRADDTVAKDPNGLDARGQHTSAYDEALIARRALAMPAFLKYDQTQSALFDIKPRHRVGLVNQNLMLTRYRGDLGGKLGWTDAAGATYVGMARRHHVTLIVALLHCPPLTEFTYATRLLNWGFAVDGEVRPVGALAGPRSAAPAGPPRPAAPADHPAAPAKAAATPQLAASGGPGADRTTMAVGFLVAAGLIVLGFVLSARRSVVRSRSGRG
jgi:D-alanyl-D-alanine carboxypeptidase (penicillin-binding protein 5/6)